MFSNEYRLRANKTIAQVFNRGKYIHGKHLLIKYLPNRKENCRIAISVSTKLFKRAVDRNLIKRKIRETVRPRLNTLPNVDLLIIAKKELPTNITIQEMSTDISNIFNKLTSSKN